MFPAEMSVRTYRKSDYGQIIRLFVEGMQDTRITDVDKETMVTYIDYSIICGDLSQLEETYLQDDSGPKGNFWVITIPFEVEYFKITPEHGKEEIIGTLALQRISDEVCELRRFSIKRSHRKRGLGMKLINFVLDYAADQGFKKCILQTDSLMVQGIALYKKCGFVHVRSIPLENNHLLLEDFEIDLQGRKSSL